MAQRGLTELLKTHHDKLNQHTTAIKDIKHDIEVLQQAVQTLEQQLASEQRTTSDDETSGFRAGLVEWLTQLNELM